ncbi:unnamed protein product [Blepharisma stoltei]|uniref:Uncharacterized protein n=1 Tax=Blepharisma stoltei TaxID=1481888 RepID=A0AAU9JPM7_9CILI|nr:unnamed protein product [Blepharisma stoltei]
MKSLAINSKSLPKQWLEEEQHRLKDEISKLQGLIQQHNQLFKQATSPEPHPSSKRKNKVEKADESPAVQVRKMPKRAATEKKKSDDFLIPVALALRYDSAYQRGSKKKFPRKRGRPKSISVPDKAQTKISFKRKT